MRVDRVVGVKRFSTSLALLVAVGCGALDEADGSREAAGSRANGEQSRVLEGAGATPPSAGAAPPSLPGLGGFLVWESNRSGRWRLWTRNLEGSGPRQLTRNEPRRRHCCAHVAPGGEWIAYLSLPAGKQEYSKGGVTGPLRLIRPDGSAEVELVPAARTYFEHRAVVWRSGRELIYIDDQGRTSVLDTETRKARLLTSEPLVEYGRLIDAHLSHATGGRADFSLYDAERGTVATRPDAPGCQPYFSHDGRWGFWMAGVGGPINRLDLASRESSPILHKNDGRLPPGLGYLYFRWSRATVC